MEPQQAFLALITMMIGAVIFTLRNSLARMDHMQKTRDEQHVEAMKDHRAEVALFRKAVEEFTALRAEFRLVAQSHDTIHAAMVADLKKIAEDLAVIAGNQQGILQVQERILKLVERLNGKNPEVTP